LIFPPNETKLQSENLGSLKKNPNPISRYKNIRSLKKRGKREKHSKIKIARKRRVKKTNTNLAKKKRKK